MVESAYLPRMRTIDGLFRDIHTIDPSSQVSKNFIRGLIIAGKVKSVRAGSKYLANLDEVLQYLANPPREKEETIVVEYGRLRRIEA